MVHPGSGRILLSDVIRFLPLRMRGMTMILSISWLLRRV